MQNGTIPSQLPDTSDFLAALDQFILAAMQLRAASTPAIRASFVSSRTDQQPEPQLPYDSPMTTTPVLVPRSEILTGAEFRALREAAGFTQRQAADCCKVDTATVFRWETDKQKRTHKSMNDKVNAGIELMRRAAERREANARSRHPGQPHADKECCAMTRAELVHELARRERKTKVA